MTFSFRLRWIDIIINAYEREGAPLPGEKNRWLFYCNFLQCVNPWLKAATSTKTRISLRWDRLFATVRCFASNREPRIVADLNTDEVNGTLRLVCIEQVISSQADLIWDFGRG